MGVKEVIQHVAKRPLQHFQKTLKNFYSCAIGPADPLFTKTLPLFVSVFSGQQQDHIRQFVEELIVTPFALQMYVRAICKTMGCIPV